MQYFAVMHSGVKIKGRMMQTILLTGGRHVRHMLEALQ